MILKATNRYLTLIILAITKTDKRETPILKLNNIRENPNNSQSKTINKLITNINVKKIKMLKENSLIT